ncbi:MAG TPA: flagellar biosynthetic protein FliO [Cellvibrionaceae bacterium]
MTASRALQLIITLGILCCVPIASFGADISDSAAANGYPFTTTNNPKDIKSAPVGSDTSIVKTFGGLGLVLALIFVLAKVGKKFHPNICAPDRALKIVSMLSLGTKEKVALIQVGKKQLLIGVTPQSINTLMELAEPIDVDSTPSVSEKSLLSARTASEFSRKLNEFLLAGQRHK